MEANPESLAILAAAAAATSAGGPSERSPSHGAPYSKKRKHPQHLAVDPALSDLGVGTSTGAANDLSIDHYLANPDHRAQRYDLGQLHHSLAHEPYLGHSPAHTTPPPDIKDLKRQVRQQRGSIGDDRLSARTARGPAAGWSRGRRTG
jgi:hypothetical protein